MVGRRAWPAPRTIVRAAEYVAREFLSWTQVDDFGLASRLMWFDREGYHRDDPGPTPDFFFALWEECKRRRISVFPSLAIDSKPEQSVTIMWDGIARHIEVDDLDPREALIRCVEHWLDASESEA
jgi:hypothetical protein